MDPTREVLEAVAEAVRTRREQLGLTQDEIKARGGPGRTTVELFENQYRWPRLARTRASWARALDWEPDAFERLARGATPEEVEQMRSVTNEIQMIALELHRLVDELVRRIGQ
jgi:hypothetical protein